MVLEFIKKDIQKIKDRRTLVKNLHRSAKLQKDAREFNKLKREENKLRLELKLTQRRADKARLIKVEKQRLAVLKEELHPSKIRKIKKGLSFTTKALGEQMVKIGEAQRATAKQRERRHKKVLKKSF